MNLVIRADRKIGKEIIAEHAFKGARIIDRIVDFLFSIDQKEVFIASAKDLKVRNTSKIPLSKIDSLDSKNIIDLQYAYDGRKLAYALKRGKPLNQAIVIENSQVGHLDYMGCLYERKEWNPISKYYIEPWGEKMGYWLRNTRITPNAVSFINILLSLFASGLLFLGLPGRILFGVWVRLFHMWDIVDGQIARLKCQGTSFGKWVDGAGDRLVLAFWYLFISGYLYFKLSNVIFLFLGLFVLYGNMMYNYLLYTSVAYFRNNRFDVKSNSKVNQNLIVRFILLFVNHDIHLHLLTLAVIFNKLDLFIIFYAFYFNFMWFMYFIFYLLKYLREGDVKEG